MDLYFASKENCYRCSLCLCDIWLALYLNLFSSERGIGCYCTLLYLLYLQDLGLLFTVPLAMCWVESNLSVLWRSLVSSSSGLQYFPLVRQLTLTLTLFFQRALYRLKHLHSLIPPPVSSRKKLIIKTH